MRRGGRFANPPLATRRTIFRALRAFAHATLSANGFKKKKAEGPRRECLRRIARRTRRSPTTVACETRDARASRDADAGTLVIEPMEFDNYRTERSSVSDRRSRRLRKTRARDKRTIGKIINHKTRKESKSDWLGGRRRREHFNGNENFYRLVDDYRLTRRR